MFRQYENQCDDVTSVVIKYTNCHVETINLNITRIKENFPSVRTIYWFCKGYCHISDKIIDVDIVGCLKGKNIQFFFIFSLQEVASVMIIFMKIPSGLK